SPGLSARSRRISSSCIRAMYGVSGYTVTSAPLIPCLGPKRRPSLSRQEEVDEICRTALGRARASARTRSSLWRTYVRIVSVPDGSGAVGPRRFVRREPQLVLHRTYAFAPLRSGARDSALA